MGSGVTDGLVEEYAALMPCVSTLDGTIDRLAQVSALWAFLKARGWPGPHKYMVPWVLYIYILYTRMYSFNFNFDQFIDIAWKMTYHIVTKLVMMQQQTLQVGPFPLYSA